MLHRGKTKLKVEFDVHVQRITGLAAFAGSALFVSWKRDSRKKCGLTRRALVDTAGVATFDEHVVFAGTLYTSATGTADRKMLELDVRSTSSDGTRLLMRTRVDLASIAHITTPTLTAPTPTPPQRMKLPLELTRELEKAEKRRCKAPQQGAPVLEATFQVRPLTHSQRLPHQAGVEHAASPSEHESSTSEDATGGPTSEGVSGDESADEGGDAGGESDGDTGRQMEQLLVENEQQRVTIAELQRTIRELKQQQKVLGGAAAAAAAAGSGTPPLSASLTVDTPPHTPLFPHRSLCCTPGSSSLLSRSAATTPTKARPPDYDAFRTPQHMSSSEGAQQTPLQQQKLVRNQSQYSSLGRTTSFCLASKAGALHRSSGSVSNALLSDPSTFAQLKARYERLALIEREVYRCQGTLSDGVPTAATALWGALVEWRALPTGNTELVKSVTRAIAAACDVLVGNAARMAYWVAAATHMLRLLRKAGVATDAALSDDERRAATETASVLDACLTSQLFGLYKMLVQHVVDAVRPFVVPVVLRSGLAAGTNRLAALGEPSRLITRAWDDVCGALRANGADHAFAAQVLAQVCYVVAALLFNHLLAHAQDCTAETGLQMLMALAPLSAWLADRGFTAAVGELGLPLEVARLLTTKKENLVHRECLATVCPTLSVAQVCALAERCKDTPPAVLDQLARMDSVGEPPARDIDESFLGRLVCSFVDAPTQWK